MFIGDLHIHSKYARACSKDITLQRLADNAKLKGLSFLGTGDFQHPKHYPDILNSLQEDSNGILWTKETNPFPFIWQTEISLMYKQDGKGRRIHHTILSPNKGVTAQIIESLGKRGRMDYDGRPIFGFSSIELVEMMRSISEDIEIIPAHCLTPYFGIFGSMSGFDSFEDCFKEKSKYVNAVETGLSAAPPMLWRVSKFDKLNLISSSDPHSYHSYRLGREATLFDFKQITYQNIIKAIRTGEGLSGTIEVDPNYGKYHFDGHRVCGVSFSPEESKKHNNICPVCRQKLTIGVQNRIEQLADRPEGFVKNNAKKFYSLLPLAELISVILKKGVSTKTVLQEYNKLISKFNTELNVLMDVSLEDLKLVVNEKIAETVIKIREGKVRYKPGFDGNYGRVILDDKDENNLIKEDHNFLKSIQKGLDSFSH
ncbi:DNA helicase UvrD [Candidatus Woesearchaeota archaeon]|nr:DNA helicase UvrD [Candidatus Woesearchaeota archaeon]